MHKLWLGGNRSTTSVSIYVCRCIENQLICALFIFPSGFIPGQAARSRSVPGVLGLHVGEEHPQRLPYCSSGVHEQTPACQQSQPRPPPLQETPALPQQDRAALLDIQQGQIQELQHHVKTAGFLLGKGGQARRGGIGGGPGCESSNVKKPLSFPVFFQKISLLPFLRHLTNQHREL